MAEKYLHHGKFIQFTVEQCLEILRDVTRQRAAAEVEWIVEHCTFTPDERTSDPSEVEPQKAWDALRQIEHRYRFDPFTKANESLRDHLIGVYTTTFRAGLLEPRNRVRIKRSPVRTAPTV